MIEVKFKYSEATEDALRALDKKIEEITDWYENRFLYALSEEEYDYFNRSYYRIIQPYLAQKARIIERSCPRVLITAETAEETQEMLKRLKQQN